MTSVVAPILTMAGEVSTFIFGELPNITAAVTGNGIIMAMVGIWLTGSVIGIFSRLLRSV